MSEWWHAITVHVQVCVGVCDEGGCDGACAWVSMTGWHAMTVHVLCLVNT